MVNSHGDYVIKGVIVVLLVVEILVMLVIMPQCDSEEKLLFFQEIVFKNT